MGKFDGSRREKTRVLPSGVKVSYRAFIGDHQALITQGDEKKRREAIDDMLWDCLMGLGDLTRSSLSRKSVEKMLAHDRGWLLFELRQFSNDYSPNFIVDYEFHMDGNGNRRKQRYEIVFDKKDFPARPYFWTYDKMKELYLDEKKFEEGHVLTEEELDDMLATMEFPDLGFENYDEMLTKHKDQSVVLPDTGVQVFWTLLDGAREKEFAKANKIGDINSHGHLLQRDPMYDEDVKDKTDRIKVPLGKMTFRDIEALRKDIVSKEADIDTSVVVQYREDSRTQAQLNLISMPSFFFPSLAT